MNDLIEKYPSEIEDILAKYPEDQKRSAVMPLLYLAQRGPGYITKQAMSEIAEILDISITDVAGIVGFYTLYYDEPGGKYHIQVCSNLTCSLLGSDDLIEHIKKKLKIDVGETSPDKKFTLTTVECLGACEEAPCMMVNFEYHGQLDENKIDNILDGLK